MGKTHDPSALDVAAAVIEARPGLDQMQLHKLLYLVQAASLAWFQEPAYVEPIEAWKRGPVTRRVAGHYKSFSYHPIETPVSGDSSVLTQRVRWVVERITEEYGDFSGSVLAAILKGAGSPWQQARGDLPIDADSDVEIPQSLMAEYHRHRGLPTRSDPTAAETALAQRFFDGDDDAMADLFEQSTGVRPSAG